MLVFREHNKISGSVRLDVLDVGFQRAQQVFWFPEVGCVRCGFSESTIRFQFPEVGCVRCGFSESTIRFQIL